MKSEIFQFEKLPNFQNLTTWKVYFLQFYHLENQYFKIKHKKNR